MAIKTGPEPEECLYSCLLSGLCLYYFLSDGIGSGNYKGKMSAKEKGRARRIMEA